MKPVQARNWNGWLTAALLGALAAAFALRLTGLALQDIWWDEARNLDVALRPLSEIAGARELDIQPPLYYWLLHGWLRLLDLGRGSEPAALAWSARFVSVWFGVAGVALTVPLARRLGGVRAGLTAALLAALAPFWLAESQETRMYTLGLALLGAAAWTLLRGFEAQGEPWRRRFGLLAPFAVLSAAAMVAHYNALFVLVAWYIWWGVAALRSPNRFAEWGALVGTGAASVILFLPILPTALRQIPDYANPNLTVPTPAAYLRENWVGHLAGYAWDASRAFGAAPWWLWGVLAAAGIGLGLLTWRLARPAAPARQRSLFGFLIVWLAGGLLLYYLAVLDRGAFNVRYSAFVTPALFVLVATAFAAWGRWTVATASPAPMPAASIQGHRPVRCQLAMP